MRAFTAALKIASLGSALPARYVSEEEAGRRLAKVVADPAYAQSGQVHPGPSSGPSSGPSRSGGA